MKKKLHPFKTIFILGILSVTFLSFKAIEHTKFGQTHLSDMYAFMDDSLVMKNFLDYATFPKNALGSLPDDNQTEKPKSDDHLDQAENLEIQNFPESESMVWIDEQTSWENYTQTTTNLKITDGLAGPINASQSYGFKSKMVTFNKLTKVANIVFKQSTVWDNWTEVPNVGPSNATDAPILLSVQDGEYYFLARESATSGYIAWQSSDMVNWTRRGSVTGTGNETGKWATTAEYKDGKFYIYYDSTNDDKPTLVIDEDLTDGIIGTEMGTAFDDPTPGSDCSVFRDDADGLFHIIYEDWSPLNARNHAWDSPLAGHVSSADGLNGFVYGEHPPVIDERTTPTGETGTYQHPQMGTLTYEIHEPEQNAYGDFTTIKVGSQYYIFSDYDPIGQEMTTARFTSDSLYKEFELVGNTGSGHPDPTIAFAEGQFYLVTQQNTDQVSPGPWVNGVEARAGVDEDGDGTVDTWTDWQVIKESYDHKPGYARVVDVTPAGIDMSSLPKGYGVQFEFTVDNSIVPDVSPIISSVALIFGEGTTTSIDNIAYLKPTLQSSDYLTGITGSSDKAVDGNVDGNYKNNSVTHTKEKGSTNPWWRVDLGAIYDISSINIFNRTNNCCVDRLSGAKVFIGNSDSTNPTDYTEIGILTADLQQVLTEIDSNGRYLLVYLEGESKILSLAEVQVYGEIVLEPIENIAYLKPTSQSTDYQTGNKGSSDNAVDGNTDGSYTNGSVTHTQKEGSTNPWWRVDLGATYNISGINIFNRTDLSCANVSSCPERLEGAKVYVGNTYSTDPEDYTEVATLTADIEQNLSNLSVTGRYVMVYHEGGSKILSLAEVQVFGELMAEEKPNFIFIMVDDLGKEWVGSYGATGVETPNIDALADNGIKFNNAYSMPQCTPSRVALLTGQYPYNNGWINHYDVPRWGHGANFDADQNPSFAKTLRDAGYRTAAAGKWQINDFRVEPEAMVKAGFDDYCMWTGYESGVPASNERYWDPYIHTKEGSRTYEGSFGPDVFSDFIVDFMKENKDDPMCIYYPMVLTHTPFVNTPLEQGLTTNYEKHQAMVRYTDFIVGKLTDALEELNISDNTYLVFTTDNGTVGSIIGGRDDVYVKGGKTYLSENGINAPFLVVTPDKKHYESDALIDFTDIYATLLDLAGVEDDNPTGNGKSFANVLLKENIQESQKDWVVSMGSHPASLDEEDNTIKNYHTFRDRIIRDDQYKAYVNTSKEVYRIFDLENDPYEKQNLIDQPEMDAVLAKFNSIVSTLPSEDNNPTYEKIASDVPDTSVAALNASSKRKNDNTDSTNLLPLSTCQKFIAQPGAEGTCATKTNVILIMADDLGWGDTGYNGSIYATPNLDAMAANGIQFNRFYSASAVCSPTRASVLTGRNPNRVGIPNANTGRLEADETTLAEILQANGYHTGMFGKWHLGTLTTSVDESNRGGPGSEDIFSVPWENGFDEAFVTEAKVPTYNPMRLNSALAQPSSFEDSNYYGTAYWTPPANGIGEGTRVALDDNLEGDDSRVIMDRVLPFIENAVDNSEAFFSVVWFHTPHKPVVLDEEMEAIYGTAAWNAMTEEERQYGSAITAMDLQIGRLQDKLEALGVADDTMIWFTSDNGPENDTPLEAGPFKARKRSLYEGGVRVPGLMEWPRQITQPKETDVPMVTSDYYPTILDLLNIQDTGNKPLDGISMKNAITRNTDYRGTPIGFKYGNQKSLVNDCYKLYQNGTGAYQLYDLINDKEETNDIAASNAELVNLMAPELLNWEVAVTSDVDYQFNTIPFCGENIENLVSLTEENSVQSGKSSMQTTIYPNPASDYVDLYYPDKNNPVINVWIYDFSGRVVESISINYKLIRNNTFSITTAHLEQGMYVLQLEFVSGAMESHNLVVK